MELCLTGFIGPFLWDLISTIGDAWGVVLLSDEDSSDEFLSDEALLGVVTLNSDSSEIDSLDVEILAERRRRLVILGLGIG